MSDKPTRVIDEDGSIYAAEIVPPEGDTYGAKYHVDLVRASVDEYGLGREQRLTVGQYSSWGEAEEHLHAVEDDLTEHGLAALGESAQHLREQPYGDDIVYLTAVYPPDGPAEADHAAHLLAIGPDRLDSAPLTPPVDYAAAGLVRDRIDGAFAGEGPDAGLIAAREEAERSGTRSLGTPLFDADDGAVRHIDGGGTAHWFAIAEREAPAESEPYELRYYRVVEMADGVHLADSYAVMPLPDDDPGSAWPLPGLETHLQQGDVFMAQMLAHNVADAYGQTFPEPAQLPALDPRLFTDGPPDRFETLRENPSLEASRAAVDIPHWRFDTLPVNDPDGEPLGQSLHMVVYPHLEHDPESPAISPDEPFRMLEVAHFETNEAAEKFIADFNGYLMPGLLEGPELAQEVARLEGLPVEWKTLDGDDLTAYQNADLTLIRDPANWQPYNPHAERDARIEAEGLYNDPIQHLTLLDEEEDEPEVESTAPDFDL